MVNKILEEKLKDIPTNPGVYLMKRHNKIIYIGKAKNLKNRVLSYFNHEHTNEKTKELVKNIEDIEFIICNSEVDAFILENNLIKKHSPKYNIDLKDEKTYPYIRISKEKFPNIKIIRTTKALDNKNAIYFGPYPHGAFHLKKTLVKIFKIRDCDKNMSKIYSRPCLKYYMKTCLGPCIHKNINIEYDELVNNIKQVLNGNSSSVVAAIREKMEQYSQNMNFEKAIISREQIKELENVQTSQISQYGRDLDEDIFTYAEKNDIAFICVLNIREGKILGKSSFNIKLENKIYDNIATALFNAYYSKHPIPDNIIFQSEKENEFLELKEIIKDIAHKKVEFHFPKIKSRRFDLMSMGITNLNRDIESHYKKKSVIEEGMSKIYDILKLKNYPRKIECFDISNIQGKDAVASMSVSIEGRPSKKDYRKFKIRCKDTPDDFMMMREVIMRRYSKLEPNQFPDIVLIDGGLGQINAAGKIFEELGKSGIADLLSLAKRDEEIYKYGESTPYSLPKDQEALKIFQRVRDEAHRFGITFHRKLRSKRVVSSILDNISGVGDIRKQALLKKYGSVANILRQNVKELSTIIPENLAKKILTELKAQEEK